MGNSQKIDIKAVIIIAGAMIATIIGSGFATGQEVIQYFVAWGWKGILGIIGIFIGFAFVGYSFLTTGYDFRDQIEAPNDIYRVYCGKTLGTFYDYFATFFLLLSYSIMIAGAGATINQQFGTPNMVGSIIMLIVVVITVAMGLEKLTNILGNLGPFIAISTIILGLYGLFTNIDGLKLIPQVVNEAIARGDIQVASNSWWLAAANYVGFNMIWIAAFLSQTGKNSDNRKQAGLGGIAGAAGFSVAILMMTIAFMATFTAEANGMVVGGSQVPTLVLANLVHPYVGYFFSLIICLGIFTSAVPLLWGAVSAFSQDGTSKHKVFTLAFGIAGYLVGSLLDFDRLINIVYVLNGYIGIALCLIMVVRMLQWHQAK